MDEAREEAHDATAPTGIAQRRSKKRVITAARKEQNREAQKLFRMCYNLLWYFSLDPPTYWSGKCSGRAKSFSGVNLRTFSRQGKGEKSASGTSMLKETTPRAILQWIFLLPACKTLSKLYIGRSIGEPGRTVHYAASLLPIISFRPYLIREFSAAQFTAYNHQSAVGNLTVTHPSLTHI